MTGRPETLEAALAWLAEQDGELQATKHFAAIEIPSEIGAGVKYADKPVHNGDIPAAIVEAVGQVFDAVNGKDGAE